MRLLRSVLVLASLCIIGTPRIAAAQDGLIVQPPLPQGFDRGRNVSVQARSRPDYAPLGVRIGGLTAFPRIAAAVGATSNAYLSRSDGADAIYTALEPSIRVQSLWSRHSLQIDGAAALRHYARQPRRDKQLWEVGARSELEFGRAVTISGEARASRGTEQLLSGEIDPGTAALSRFRRDAAALRGTYTSGRLRAVLIADHAAFRFASLEARDGSRRDQAYRDRRVDRLAGQIEYGQTPSMSLFAQLAHAATVFDRPESAFLGSRATTLLVGLNVDIAGRARGTVAIGYGGRDYRRTRFAVDGAVIEARGELFPLACLTITAAARRSIEDATAGNAAPQPFWNNRLSLGGDYELRGNLILSAIGDYARQTGALHRRRNATFRLAASARYLWSRRATLSAGMSYAARSSSGDPPGSGVGEGRIEAALAYHL